jgi:hypothetical protein
MRRILTILLLALSLTSGAATYYVATTGDNGAAGTIAAPWATWHYAFNQLTAGDTLYIRGGTYTPASTNVSGAYFGARVSNIDGTANDPIVVLNYPGEVPILSGASITEDGEHVGAFWTLCSYWVLKGLIIQSVPQHATGDPVHGLYVIYSDNFTIENCITRYNGGVGTGIIYECDDITLINCDSHHNYDPYTVSPGAYGNADGFELAENLAGSVITLSGCRSWDNSDDGFDCWESDGEVNFNRCWSWMNGYRENRSTTGGDGNGFKLGQTATADGTLLLRTVTNCASFFNRNDGFGTNNAFALIDVYNCTAYDNGGTGFNITSVNDIAYEFINCASFENTYNFGGFAAPYETVYTTNTYHPTYNPSGPIATSEDFVSVDSTGVSGARQSDKSLPLLTFLHLTPGSDLIGAGTDVNLTTDGDGETWNATPSIGAYEYKGTPTPDVFPGKYVVRDGKYQMYNGKLVINNL